jgi:WD40 repeat protein
VSGHHVDVSRKRIALLRQILLFALFTLLGLATNYVANASHPPVGLRLLEQFSLPLAGGIAVVIIAVMIWQHREEEGEEARPEWDSDRPPFPGLEAFTEQDAGVFFGRSAETAELLDRLHPAGAGLGHRLIAVVGPSGVGKSSLVSAGLLPRLAHRRRKWLVPPPFVPEDHPVQSLARSLASAGGGSVVSIAARLAAEPGGLAASIEDLRAAGGRPGRVLVVIDQGEELLTLAGAGEREDFLRMLECALEADQQLWIVLIMRSEFLTAFLATSHARLFRDPVTVGALSRNALVEVIAGPAARAGVRFDPPELVQLMAHEAGGGNALPLLAFTLQELYLDAGKSRVVTGAEYRRMHGVTGALTRQADRVTAELRAGDPDSPVLATLLRFVAITDGAPARRRVRSSSLDPCERRVADAFVSARLLVSSAGADHGDAVLDVAHEALFQHWAPLRQEIEAHAEELQRRADLERWAADWERSGRQDSYLLRADRLRVASLFADPGATDPASLLVTEFVDRSIRADSVARERLSETIAKRAMAEISEDPEHSLMLALAAVEECAPTPAAQQALVTALSVSRLRRVLRGHERAVTSVDWSPDGSRIATSSADGTAWIWDPLTQAELLVLRGHGDEVRAVAWSPDGTSLATTSADKTTRIWDAATGRQRIILRGHQEGGWGVAWSPAGDRIATSSNDCTTKIWDAADGRELLTLRGHEDHTERAAWSPDGGRIATVSSDATVRVWDAATGAQLMVLRGHESAVRGVSWSPDGRRIASCSNDTIIRIWDAADGTGLMRLRGHGHTVGSVAWSPDGSRLASASSDRTVRIWDGQRGSALLVLRGPDISPFRVSWSPDGRFIATAADNRTAQVWEAGDVLEQLVLRGHASIVRSVDWSPDGRSIATASDDRTACAWDSANGARLTTMHHDLAVRAVAWSPDGRRIATGSSDKAARIWDPRTGDQLLALYGHDRPVWGVAWSPDGGRLVTCSIDEAVRIWDAQTGVAIATLTGHDDAIRRVSWSPDGSRIATASNDRTARIWDVRTGSLLHVLRGHDLTVRAAEWSGDSRRIVTASDDRVALIWDTDHGTLLTGLHGHAGWILGADWSHHDQRIATASADGTIRIWDAETGSQLTVAGVQADRAEAVAWSPDGTRLASASRDGTARLWDATVSLAAIADMARSRLTRSLTADERRNLMLPTEPPASLLRPPKL